MMPRVWIAILVSLLLGSSARGQQGQDDPAAQAFAQGTQLFLEGQYSKAIEAFERSYALHKHFLTLCNIGRCHQRAKNMTEAATYYRRCLEEGGDRSPKAEEIRAALAQTQAEQATITIESSNGAGTAYVNGRVVGETPAQVSLQPGTYRIEVHQPSARPARITIDVETGERRTVVLRPAVTASREAEQPLTSESSTSSGEASQKPSRRRLSQAWFWTSAAVTLGLVAAASVCGVMTLRAHSEYKSRPTESGYNQVIKRRLITNVLWGATAAAGGATTVLFFFTSFKRAPRQPVEDFAYHLPTTGSTFGLGLAGQF